MMTIEQFDLIPNGEIFATGVLPNSPDGLFMTNNGGELRWIAQKGFGYDWTIYCHWSDHSEDWIAKHGDKIHNEKHIKKCVKCDEKTYNLYRF